MEVGDVMTCFWCDRDDLGELLVVINVVVEFVVREGWVYFVDWVGLLIVGFVCVDCGDVVLWFGGDW